MFPIVEGKRFWDFKLNELIDYQSYQVGEFVEGQPTPALLADRVIVDCRYPFHLGKPDDTHLFNCYHGDYKWCKRVDIDFWQKASETARLLVGDCEDTSILYTAGARRVGVSSSNVYEVFGVVKDNGNVLGGHGWSVCRWDDKWHLIESTLDIPPSEYPIVPNINKPFRMGSWVYHPEILFNDEKFSELSACNLQHYADRKFNEKETRAKYEALAKAWHIQTKPLNTSRFLYKLRWKK